MAEDGRDLRRSSRPARCSSGTTGSRLPRTTSWWLLSYLQRWKLHEVPGQPVPALTQNFTSGFLARGVFLCTKKCIKDNQEKQVQCGWTQCNAYRHYCKRLGICQPEKTIYFGFILWWLFANRKPVMPLFCYLLLILQFKFSFLLNSSPCIILLLRLIG